MNLCPEHINVWTFAHGLPEREERIIVVGVGMWRVVESFPPGKPRRSLVRPDVGFRPTLDWAWRFPPGLLQGVDVKACPSKSHGSFPASLELHVRASAGRRRRHPPAESLVFVLVSVGFDFGCVQLKLRPAPLNWVWAPTEIGLGSIKFGLGSNKFGLAIDLGLVMTIFPPTCRPVPTRLGWLLPIVRVRGVRASLRSVCDHVCALARGEDGHARRREGLLEVHSGEPQRHALGGGGGRPGGL